MTEDNKPFSQVPQPQEVNDSNGAVKCPFGGRPTVDESPELQKEYVEIYLAKIIDGMNEGAIAITRKISIGKVKCAFNWCRRTSIGCSTAEELVDAVNRLDYRLKPLIHEQNRFWRLLAKEHSAVDALPAGSELSFIQVKRMESLSRTCLIYEDRIQPILREIHAMRRLLGNFIPNDEQSLNPQIQWIHEVTEEIKQSGLSQQERLAIAKMLRNRAGKQESLES